MPKITRENLEKANKTELVELAAGIKDKDNQGLILDMEMTKPVMIDTILMRVEELGEPGSGDGPPSAQGKAPETPDEIKSRMVKEIDKNLPLRLYPDPQVVDQATLEEIAVKWHSNAPDVLKRLQGIEHDRQVGYAAADKAAADAAEVLTPLTADEKLRMAILETKASVGVGHPHPRDMQWLGRARIRLLITPLNANERRRLEELGKDEADGILIDTPGGIAELAMLRKRPEPEKP